jgi:beta-glucosidase
MRITLFILLAGFFLSALPGNTPPLKKEQIEQRVADLLSKMSVEEKVGQMTQITIEVVSKKQGTKDQLHELNDKALEEAITKYHVGSILNVYDVAHTVDYWHEIIGKVDAAAKKTRLAIPVIYGIDAIHGATYTQGATLFPQAISMAATFNPELAYIAGEITSKEVKASGIPWNFYPVLDVGRQVLWPRFWETFGEDPYLVTLLGSKYITGAQGENVAARDKLMTCLKHYVGYSSPNNGKDRSPAWISERMLREYFLPPFEAGVKAGAMTVMANSGEVDGIPVHSDYRLLTEILKQEMKFNGFVVSDWEDIKRLYTRDRVASSPEEAVKMAVMAGVDMSMIPQDYSFYTILLGLVKKNQVPMTRIDDAVTRILRVKMMLGLFENAAPDKNLASVISSSENKAANLEAASQSIVMTQNTNGFLPLKPVKKILVTGPAANMLSVMNGGWTITWQGNEETLYPKSALTVLKALQAKYGTDKVVYSEGTTFNADVNTSKTKELAKDADAVVICLGEPAYCETPGNINNLELDEAQLNLVNEVASVNKSIVLVMLQGRPRIINKIVDKAQAVLIAMLPGMRGGEALANIISGETTPSGKLPFTYPKYPNALYHYDGKPLENTNDLKYDPQWGFGYGLSYTTFGYDNLRIEKQNYTQNDEIKVSVNVVNKGSVAGMEAVQLYLCDKYGSVSRPVRQLRGVQKILLKPGETKTVNFTLSMNDLSFIGRDNKRIVEPGEFTIYIDKLEKSFFLQ